MFQLSRIMYISVLFNFFITDYYKAVNVFPCTIDFVLGFFFLNLFMYGNVHLLIPHS